jgi:mono/diheme cytochrome c family protein
MRYGMFKRYDHLYALGAVLLLVLTASSRAAAQEGKVLYEQKCLTCHAISQTKKVSIKESASIKGPALWFAASKFKPEWLQAWLTAPEPIFGVKWGTLEKGAYAHPAVDADAAGKLTQYLMTLADAQVKAGVTPPLPKSRGQRLSMLGRTAELFEKQQGCYACHRYLNKRRTELGGFSGPSLVKASERLQPDWVFAFLKDPRRYYPNGKCPIPGEQAFNKYSDENRAALATYIVNIGIR